jgi:hypothetical protein
MPARPMFWASCVAGPLRRCVSFIEAEHFSGEVDVSDRNASTLNSLE